ncbi:MAG: alanyl-tRNA editing protein [Lachnospiraceae bacterium]|nr:alanyl-tRNA editing protein [Lachnospiraceae bacterium]
MESNIGQGTEKIYYKDAYQSVFTARVIACETVKGGFGVILDATAFFPEEGGQSADTGYLILPGGVSQCGDAAEEMRIPVLDVRIRDGVISHIVPSPVAEGSTVRGELDWARRFSNMQQHSAEHLFSGFVHSRFGYENVGFHLSDREVTMDYSGPLTEADVSSLEADVNAAIWRNFESRQLFPDKETLETLSFRSKKEIEGQVRLVEYPGVDLCACCAPHVKRTGEIGIMKVVSSQNYKGGTRIFMLAGERAYRLLTEEHRILQDVSRGFSTSYPNVPGRIRELREDTISLRRALAEAAAKQLEDKIGQLPEDLENVCLFTAGVDPVVLRKAVNAITERHSGIAGIFDGNEENGYRYILGSRISVQPLQTALRENFGAKGGGSEKMAQGSVRAKKEDIEKLFA